MGSIFEWITIEKAADALGVSSRQVYKYITKGQLTARQDGKRRLVSRKDVKVLIDCRNQGIPRAVNGLTVIRMDAELQVLKKQMETVMRILDMRYDPLGLDSQELVNLYEMANHSLKVPWSPYEESMWSDVFVKMRTEDLEKIAEEGHEQPWRPFLALAKAMYHAPHNKDLKLLLSTGVANLERIGFSYSQRVEQVSPTDLNHMIKKDNVLTGRIERKMERVQQKNTPNKE